MLLLKLGCVLAIIGILLYMFSFLFVDCDKQEKLLIVSMAIMALGASLLGIFLVGLIITTPLKPLYSGE